MTVIHLHATSALDSGRVLGGSLPTAQAMISTGGLVCFSFCCFKFLHLLFFFIPHLSDLLQLSRSLDSDKRTKNAVAPSVQASCVGGN